VISYDFFKAYVCDGIQKVNRDTFNLVIWEKPKYVIWPSMSFEIFESTFAAIRKQGCKIIGCFFDDRAGRFDSFSKFYIPYMDYIFTEASERYQKYGVKVYNLVNCLSKDYYIIGNDRKFAYDVSFVGGNIADRADYISKIGRNEIDVRVFGKGWPDGYVDSTRMMKIFNESKINLNFTKTYDNSCDYQLKGRIFDISLCGGFVLTEYVPGIEEYFDVDQEIVCFRNKDELIDKIEYYLQHDAEREKIRNKGHKRAARCYTFEQVFGKVFREIEQWKHDPIIVSRDDCIVDDESRKARGEWHLRFAYGRYMIGRSDLCIEELDVGRKYHPASRRIGAMKLIMRCSKNLVKFIYRGHAGLKLFRFMK